MLQDIPIEYATEQADSPDNTRNTAASLNSAGKDLVCRDGFSPSSPYFERTRAHLLTVSCHPFIDPEKPSGMGTNTPAMYDLAHANLCSNDHFMKNTLRS